MISILNNSNLNIHFLFLNLILLFSLIKHSTNNNLNFNINKKRLISFFKTFSIMIYFLLVFFSLAHNFSNTVCFEFNYKFFSSPFYIKSDIFSTDSITNFFYDLIAIIYFNSSFFFFSLLISGWFSFNNYNSLSRILVSLPNGISYSLRDRASILWFSLPGR